MKIPENFNLRKIPFLCVINVPMKFLPHSNLSCPPSYIFLIVLFFVLITNMIIFLGNFFRRRCECVCVIYFIMQI